jgi:SAM-dependent methyltransferase
MWAHGSAYESFMGRWSRQVAPRFVRWLGAPRGLRWIDAGCGSGALTSAVLSLASPVSVVGVDPSEGFVEQARRLVEDERATFEVMSAEDLPADSADVVVSGLMLNFVVDALETVKVMAQAAPGGVVGAYVWDYGGRMEMLRTFWDVACALDVSAIDRDESHLFTLCEPGGLEDLFVDAGLSEVTPGSVEIDMEFRDFDDLWQPFLGGVGPGPAYVATLDDAGRERLRAEYQRMVHPDPERRITLQARAWAVRGRAA